MILSFSPFGYEGSLVTVECDLRRGVPAFDIVGLADGAIAESRERVRCAIRNSGFELPPEKILLSLSPCDLRKEGAGFDLPIALSVLMADAESKCKLTHSQDEKVMVMGELELSGRIRPVKGISAALQTAVTNGIKYAIIPKCSEREPDGILCYRAETLEEAFHAMTKVDDGETEECYSELIEKQKAEKPERELCEFTDIEGSSLDDIKGHEWFKYAMAVAIAGRHSLLAVGSPGCGKTLVLKHAPELMPSLTPEETQSTTRIWSLAGLTKPSESWLKHRPFRIPHQTASLEGICGGGPNCRPGEVSLAHNGILFLDEAAEFRSAVLQMLRSPLENGSIVLARAGRSTTYPANFQLFMATNPCPCGNYGSKTKICLCSAKSIEQYWKKFSAPLLDRVPIRVHCDEEHKINEDVSVKELRRQIKLAMETQFKRQSGWNDKMSPNDVLEHCALSVETQNFLDGMIVKNGYSPRAVSYILKVARTYADMHGREKLTTEDVKFACELRKVCGEIKDIIDEKYV